MRKIASIILFFVIISGISAQEKASEPEFTVTGKPVILVYTNYHAGFGDHNEISGFELTRAYLGYQFQLTSNLSGKFIVDAAVPPSESFMAAQKREIYLKNALLTWKGKGFTIHGGLISLLEFGLQEKFWGRRYIAPSFQDLYKMGSSADLGITAEYRFTPWIAADISITNGEGYKHINMDNKYRTGFGTTINPVHNLTIRVYGDISQQSLADEDQRTLALFAGYKCNYFSLGAEYNHQKNNQFKSAMDYFGYSFYTTVPVHKKWNLFGRYDYIDSKDKDNNSWISFTGNLLIAGVEYLPMKNLKFALNYRHTKDFDTELLVHNIFHTAYLNVEFLW